MLPARANAGASSRESKTDRMPDNFGANRNRPTELRFVPARGRASIPEWKARSDSKSKRRSRGGTFEPLFPPSPPSLQKASGSRAKALRRRNFRPFGIESAKTLPFLRLFQTCRRIFSKASCGILRFFRLRKTLPPQIPRIENRAGTHLKGKLSATSAFPKSFPFCPEKATFKIERRAFPLDSLGR